MKRGKHSWLVYNPSSTIAYQTQDYKGLVQQNQFHGIQARNEVRPICGHKTQSSSSAFYSVKGNFRSIKFNKF